MLRNRYRAIFTSKIFTNRLIFRYKLKVSMTTYHNNRTLKVIHQDTVSYQPIIKLRATTRHLIQISTMRLENISNYFQKHVDK